MDGSPAVDWHPKGRRGGTVQNQAEWEPTFCWSLTVSPHPPPPPLRWSLVVLDTFPSASFLRGCWSSGWTRT